MVVKSLTAGAPAGTGISSGTNLSSTWQSVNDLGDGWARCHAFGVTPAGTVAVVIRFSASNTSTAPAATTADIAYSGGSTYGLDLSAPQVSFAYGDQPWAGLDSRTPLPDAYVFPITTQPAGTALSVRFLLYGLPATDSDPNRLPASCAIVGAGLAQSLGDSEWGVETSYLSFSRRERDETFGTVTFMKRGAAKTARATGYLDTSIVTGDAVQRALIAADGVPSLFDFNNSDSDYSRLRVFGFVTQFRSIIQAASWESVTLDIEGLVEEA